MHNSFQIKKNTFKTDLQVFYTEAVWNIQAQD